MPNMMEEVELCNLMSECGSIGDTYSVFYISLQEQGVIWTLSKNS